MVWTKNSPHHIITPSRVQGPLQGVENMYMAAIQRREKIHSFWDSVLSIQSPFITEVIALFKPSRSRPYSVLFVFLFVE